MNLRYIWQRCFLKLHGVARKNIILHKTSKVEAGSTVINTTFDRYSFCGYHCKIINAKVGAFCSIADSVIIGGAQHPVKWASTSPVFYKGRDSLRKKFSQFDRDPDLNTVIGHDVWIGEGVMIKSGVTIGTGAVIGMGAVVTKDVAPYEVVGGVPAGHIKFRFDEETISLLLESQWWNLDDASLEKHAPLIRDPAAFARSIMASENQTRQAASHSREVDQ